MSDINVVIDTVHKALEVAVPPYKDAPSIANALAVQIRKSTGPHEQTLLSLYRCLYVIDDLLNNYRDPHFANLYICLHLDENLGQHARMVSNAINASMLDENDDPKAVELINARGVIGYAALNSTIPADLITNAHHDSLVKLAASLPGWSPIIGEVTEKVFRFVVENPRIRGERVYIDLMNDIDRAVQVDISEYRRMWLKTIRSDIRQAILKMEYPLMEEM